LHLPTCLCFDLFSSPLLSVPRVPFLLIRSFKFRSPLLSSPLSPKGFY
ncbi:unnamed protein product, partial [Brassica oleracea var. botrytis]